MPANSSKTNKSSVLQTNHEKKITFIYLQKKNIILEIFVSRSFYWNVNLRIPLKSNCFLFLSLYRWYENKLKSYRFWILSFLQSEKMIFTKYSVCLPNCMFVCLHRKLKKPKRVCQGCQTGCLRAACGPWGIFFFFWPTMFR